MTEDNDLYQKLSEEIVVTLIEDHKLVDGERATIWNDEIIKVQKTDDLLDPLTTYKSVTINRITGVYKYQLSSKTPEETIPSPILISYYSCSEAEKKF